MYGLLHFANRRVAAAPLLRAFSSAAGIDDLVYLGKGYKICGKDEIEGEIRRNIKTIYQTKKSCKIPANGRKVLPWELQSRNVVKLACDSSAAGGICEVYLVGSVHNCPETWREVGNVISFLKPQVVFLEMCSRQLHMLKGQPPKVPTMREMFDLWKNNEDPFWILHKWFAAKCSEGEFESGESGMAHEEAIKYAGGECGVAYEEAMKYGGKVVLGDRPSQITIRRRSATISPWVYLYEPWNLQFERELLEIGLRKEDFAEMKGTNIDPYLAAELTSKKFPAFAKTIVMERDQYMSAKILEVAREHSSVVAVVGKNHLPGIQKYWKQPVDMKEILSIPAGNKIATMGKLLNTFGAMVTFLLRSPSQRYEIRRRMSALYSYELEMRKKAEGQKPFIYEFLMGPLKKLKEGVMHKLIDK